MKLLKNLMKRLQVTAVLATLFVSVLASGSGQTSAQQAYDPNGTPTNKTPVFNYFYNVPNGVGNEADFVRVKPQAGGNASYVNSLSSACNNGDAFTVRTYIHNGSDPNFNNNGSGSAVAHNTRVAMTAPIGQSSNQFTFRSTVSASNATTVVDNAQLNCGSKTVKLSLVPNSVKTYSKPLDTQSAPDSAVNGSLTIGSRAQGSGDVWGCWEDRVIVTYEVRVEEVPNQVTSLGECRLLDVTPAANRTVNVNLNGQVTNATIVGYHVDYGDGSSSTQQTSTHQYAQDGTYVIRGTVTVRFADGTTAQRTAASCVKQVTFRGDRPPEVVVPPTTTPTELPKTGAGAIAATFLAVTSLSTAAYYAIVRKFAGV